MQLRDHPGVVSKGDIFRVSPHSLKVDEGFNVRDLDVPSAREALDELKESVREHGVQVPLEIRFQGDDIYIAHGHRRLKVVKELIAEGMDFRSIPAVAEPKGISPAERTARIYTLNNGEPLSPLEKGELVRRLVQVYGWSREEVAKKIGVKSAVMVSRYLDLANAPEPLREAVRQGEISATNAVSVVRSEGPLLAEEKLRESRATAKAAGKKKVTAKSISRKPGRPRKGEQKAPESPPKIGNTQKFDGAITLLSELYVDQYTPDRAASNTLREAAAIRELGDYLLDVAQQIEQKRAA